ncbi:MAG: peroxiredoxin family protein [Chloroflexota bacterium]
MPNPLNPRRTIFIFILLLGAAWTFASRDPSAAGTAAGISAPQQGFEAPDFTLQNLDGEPVALSDLRGQAVLVNFWATWCPPCKAEMPAIQKVYDEYKAEGFTVLAVNMSFQDDTGNIPGFMAEYGLDFPVLLENSGQVAKTYLIRSLPTSFFIDREGVIQEVVVGGPMAEALLRARIEAILK